LKTINRVIESIAKSTWCVLLAVFISQVVGSFLFEPWVLIIPPACICGICFMAIFIVRNRGTISSDHFDGCMGGFLVCWGVALIFTSFRGTWFYVISYFVFPALFIANWIHSRITAFEIERARKKIETYGHLEIVAKS
jgi:hypothetical protein